MGNPLYENYCPEVYMQEYSPAWVYLIIAILIFIIWLIFPLCLIIPFSKIPIIGKIQFFITLIIRWFDIQTSSLPVSMKLSSQSNEIKEAEIYNSDDFRYSEGIVTEEDKNKYLFYNVKDSTATIGGYFTIILVLISIFFIWLVYFSYLSPLNKFVNVHQAQYYESNNWWNTFQKDVRMELNIPCNETYNCDKFSIQILPEGLIEKTSERKFINLNSTCEFKKYNSNCKINTKFPLYSEIGKKNISD
jgi:hypothetical protein